MIFHQPYVQRCKHVNYNQIPTVYATIITHLLSDEILTLNKCKHWDLTLDLMAYYVRLKPVCNVKCDVKSPSETNVESMCKRYVVPFCKFHSFITSFQGEMLCWFHIISTNFACWVDAHRWLIGVNLDPNFGGIEVNWSTPLHSTYQESTVKLQHEFYWVLGKILKKLVDYHSTWLELN